MPVKAPRGLVLPAEDGSVHGSWRGKVILVISK